MPPDPSTGGTPVRPLTVLLLLLLATDALAWGKTGHRVTGALAEPWLTPEARAAVREILGVETLAEASTWPDEMRSAPGAFWQETANPWHYVTVPPGRRYAEVGAPPEGDAVTALARFARTLRDPGASRAERQLALRFAVHLVADLHQPLHVGNGRDRGGNDFEVRWFGRPSNLHRLWDTQLVEHEKLSFSEWAAWLGARITPEQAVAWSDADPRVWIAESAALRDRVYPEERDLSWDYAFEHLPALKERLSRAGVRIAAWLNAVFAP